MTPRLVPTETPRRRGPVGRVLDAAAVSAARRLLADMKPAGTLAITLPDGRRMVLDGRGDGIDAAVDCPNLRSVWHGVRRGSLGFAEAYIEGHVTTPDLVALLRYYVQNQAQFEAAGERFFRVRAPARLYHLLRPNSRAGARRNIAAHYDLSNEFYKLWFDGTMTYSSAYFESGANDLETAQRAKYNRVAEFLDLADGHDVLEIGCGWGGFAEFAGRKGARVTGLTLSREQFAFARERMAQAALDGRCDVRLEDYRDTQGTFDRIASIEMIEAVGEPHWPTYFATLAQRLRRSGVAAVQAITIAEPLFDTYRRSIDFIQRHVFPGGMLPTREIIAREAQAAGLRLEAMEHFGDSYARTLAEWRRRFTDSWPAIARLGFDERFRRKWEYYLAYCEAGFAERTIDVGIYRFVKDR